jgi:DNA-binding transcriptional regulator YdaS (Cro superfamily)
MATKIIEKVGRARLAAELGIARESTYKWERSGVPPNRVIAVEKISGISRHEIRPDIFGPKEAA